MMATSVSSTYVDPSSPQSLLLYPTLIDMTVLSDLVPLFRNRNFHAHRDDVTRTQLDQLILADALLTRLSDLLRYAQSLLVRTVVDNGPTNNNIGEFATLNQTAQELHKSITSKYTSSIEHTIHPRQAPSNAPPGSAPKSFLDELSPTALNTFLAFLSDIRANPELLTSRLLQAKDQDLDALVSWKPCRYVVSSRADHATRQNAPPSSSDYLVSFFRHDPLHVLTSVLFSAPCDEQSVDFPRGLDIWSTCLARLIDENRGDSVVLAVLDIWTTSPWSASTSFEIIILDFLQNASRLNYGKTKFEDVCDGSATEEMDHEMVDLFDQTILEILELVNEFGGIPSSLLRLVRSVFRKCSDRKRAKEMLFQNGFVQRFLARSVQFPEYRGLLGYSYVGDDQRLLLQSLYSRLEKYAVAELQGTNYKLLADDQLAIQMQLDALMTKFFPAGHEPDTTSASETVVQASIVLCPSDLLAAFYALYPRHRPPTVEALHPPTRSHTRKHSIESNKSEAVRSSSDHIRPILKRSNMFNLHEGSTSSLSDHNSESDTVVIAEDEEVDLYGLSVKAAIDEMRRRLGIDVCCGERHPCEEMWATLYISEDGSLSPLPAFEEAEPVCPNDHEIMVSKEADDIIESGVLKLAETMRPQKKLVTLPPEQPLIRLKENKYHEDLILLTSPRVQPSAGIVAPPSTPKSALLTALHDASSNFFSRGDYIQSQRFHEVIDLLKSITSPHLIRNDYSPVLGIIARKVQNESNNFLALVRTREVWFSHLLEERDKVDHSLTQSNEILSHLRCKMWYSNHIRQSKAWQRAKDVCDALYKMKSSPSRPPSIAADIKRNVSAVSLNRSNSLTNRERRFLPSRQSFDGFSFSGRPASMYNVSFGMVSDDWFDVLSASAEQGGPHKLSDYQVDVTNRWLEEHAAENFCRGEEIIHRFVAEIDDVARRLIPECADEMSVVATTFWESEEFVEEAKEFGFIELSRREEGRRSEDIPRNSSGVDLFGLLGRSKGKMVGGDVLDTRSIRSTHSRTTSLSVNARGLPEGFGRPGSSQSVSFPPPSPSSSLFSRQLPPMSRSTSAIDQGRATEFLEATRQRLLSLLLSDLSSEMWAAGSETDEWFADGLADACLRRKRLKPKTKESSAPRIGKKLPIVAGSSGRLSTRTFSSGSGGELLTPPLSREASGTGDDSTALNDSRSNNTAGFNFRAAYKKLLRKFSVHPAPHVKLNALFELERLMTASFTVEGPASDNASLSTPFLSGGLPPTPQASPDLTRKMSTSSAIGTDDLIDEIQRVLRDPELRPKTLFRDLSFISAFVPPVTLTHHGEGKVFWDIGLAASAMKTDTVNSMVDWYEEIMAGNERPSTRRADQSRSISIRKMQDAARMLIIAACEGNAIGQRELALLHLSHPSLLPLTILPLTRPSDTFSKFYFKGGVDDKDKYDPDRIALATHWFRLAARNGDEYAQSVEGNWLGFKLLN